MWPGTVTFGWGAKTELRVITINNGKCSCHPIRQHRKPARVSRSLRMGRSGAPQWIRFGGTTAATGPSCTEGSTALKPCFAAATETFGWVRIAECTAIWEVPGWKTASKTAFQAPPSVNCWRILADRFGPVSYTHLTLPTSDLV